MFCENCGKPIPEGKRTCDACANPLAGQLTQEPVPQEAPAQIPVPVFQPAPKDLTEPAPAQQDAYIPPSQQKGYIPPSQQPAQPVYELPLQQPVYTPPVQQPAYEAPTQHTFELNMPAEGSDKKKKKRGGAGKVFLIIVALVLVAGIVLAAINWNSITRFFKRSFAEPTDYLAEVEKNSAAAGAKTLADAYDNALASYYPEGGSSNATVTLEMDDQIMSLLTTALAQEGLELDLSWVENIMVEPAIDVYEDSMRIDLGVGINSVHLATLSAVWDMETQTIWVGVPELHETYIEMDAVEILGEEAVVMAQTMAMSRQITEELMDAMPTGAQLEDLINTYHGIVVDQISEVEKANETVKVGGVEQDLLVMTAELSQKDIVEIAINVLEEAENDETIEELLTNISDCVNGMAAMYGETETVDLYAEFQNGVSSALAEMEYALEEAENDTFLTIETFIDSQDAIVGRTITVEVEDAKIEGHYITVSDGEEFAFEAELLTVEVTGQGTTKDGKATGEFVLTVEGTDYLTLEVEDYACTESGQISGTFRLVPDSSVYELMEMDSSIAGMLGEVALTLELDGDAFIVGVEAAGTELISVGMTGESRKPSQIDLPADGVSLDDDEGGMQWVSELDLDAIVEQLEKAGVPDEYMDLVKQYVEMFEQQFG